MSTAASKRPDLKEMMNKVNEETAEKAKGFSRRASSETIAPGLNKEAIIECQNITDQEHQDQEHQDQPIIYTLRNGRSIEFHSRKLSYEEIQTKVIIPEKINPRIQEEITNKSINKIRATIKQSQFYPAIAIFDPIKGVFNLVDGSRRYRAALLEKVGLWINYTNEKISTAEAKQLAKDIQTSVKLTMREQGLQFKDYMDEFKVKQKEVAEAFECSEAKVSKCLFATTVDTNLIQLFPDPNELSYNNYKKLFEVQNSLSKAEINELKDILDTENVDVESILGQICSIALSDKKKSVKKEWNYLYQSQDKKSFSRVYSTKDKTTFELGRLPKKVINEISAFIEEKCKLDK